MASLSDERLQRLHKQFLDADERFRGERAGEIRAQLMPLADKISEPCTTLDEWEPCIRRQIQYLEGFENDPIGPKEEWNGLIRDGFLVNAGQHASHQEGTCYDRCFHAGESRRPPTGRREGCCRKAGL
jgi:hypothetical protein